MSSDFLPNSDNDLITWTTQFAATASVNTRATPLTRDQIATLETKIQDVQVALENAEAQRLAAQAATQVKKDKVNALKANARELNRIVQGSGSVTAETKHRLGLKVRPDKRKLAALATPVNVQVSVNFRNENLVTWDTGGNSPNTLYELQASFGEGEPFFTVMTLTGTRYTHQRVVPGQEMIYRVRAQRRTQLSGFSNLAVVYPQAAPVVSLPKKKSIVLKKAA